MKIAIVHDWLVTYAGAERVLEQMLNCFPEADLFSLIDFIPKGKRDFIKNKPVTTSFLQKMPFVKTKYRSYLALMPFAIEQFDLTKYDLILSSSHAVAKGVIVGPDQLHISYVYSPMRYAWDFQYQYLREANLSSGIKGLMAKKILHKMRIWDSLSANRVDYFITLSNFIQRRIQKAYRRDSVVIAPPVNVEAFQYHPKKENFYLAAARLVPYKRVDLIVDAFAKMPDKKLVVIGDGPEIKKIRSKATANITIMGYQPFEVLRDHMQRAKAFLYAAEDDFSIVMIEAQACGTPSIAYAKGAALEIVKDMSSDKPNGIFFAHQTPESAIDAVEKFERMGDEIKAENCCANAAKYKPEVFCEQFYKYVMDQYNLFRETLPQIS